MLDFRESIANLTADSYFSEKENRDGKHIMGNEIEQSIGTCTGRKKDHLA
jgi:hypothetical protein